jgi:hypothetical protein
LFWAGNAFGFCCAAGFSAPANPEKVFGWIEEGILLPENIAVKVKLDTGLLHPRWMRKT